MVESSQTHQYLQDIGRRIKSLRKERGYTLADLGENIELDKSNAHQLEQGKNFTIDILIKIAGFLEVHPKDILDAQFQSDLKQIEKAIDEKLKRRAVAKRRVRSKKGSCIHRKCTCALVRYVLLTKLNIGFSR